MNYAVMKFKWEIGTEDCSPMQHKYSEKERSIRVSQFTPFEILETLIASLIKRAQSFNIIKIRMMSFIASYNFSFKK